MEVTCKACHYAALVCQRHTIAVTPDKRNEVECSLGYGATRDKKRLEETRLLTEVWYLSLSKAPRMARRGEEKKRKKEKRPPLCGSPFAGNLFLFALNHLDDGVVEQLSGDISFDE